MAYGKFRRVVASVAGPSQRVHMEGVLTGPGTVVLGIPGGRAHDVTRRALGLCIDRSGKPIRRRLASVATHIRARIVRIVHCRAVIRAVKAQQGYIHDAVIVLQCSRPRPVMAGVAAVGQDNRGGKMAGDRIMRTGPVRSSYS